jgi:hypothetical protein
MSTKRHPDSAALERVGTPALMEHFQVTRQSLAYWRRVGVPKPHRKSLIHLGRLLGHDMNDLQP